MRGFRVDHPDPPALKRRLYDEHRIEVPIVETPAGWVMRVSVQAYNDESDLAALAARLGPESLRQNPPMADSYEVAAAFRAELRRFLRRSEDGSRANGITPRQHLLLLQIAGRRTAARRPSPISSTRCR